MKSLNVLGLALAAGLCTSAFAQCPGAPTVIEDLGTLTAGVAVNRAPTLAAGQIGWYKITLPTDVRYQDLTFLDIDSSGSAIADTEIGLYSCAGNFLGGSDDEGPSATSAMSFGHGEGTWPGGAILTTNTVNNGRQGDLPAGDYYIAVGAFNVTFGTTAFAATGASTNTGVVNVNLKYGSATVAADPVGNIDLGTLASGGAIHRTTESLAANGVQWYKVVLPEAFGGAGTYLDCDTEGTVLTATNATRLVFYTAAGALASNLQAVSATGTGTLLNDLTDGSGSLSQLTFGLTSPTRPAVGTGLAYNGRDGRLRPGTYFVAVSNPGLAPSLSAASGIALGLTSTSTNAGPMQLHLVSGALPTNPTGVGTATPTPVDNCGSASTLLRVTVTPGLFPTTTAHTVTADLTTVGGSATQSFFDDGTNGDITANDNIFSWSQPIANTVTNGAKTLPFTVASTAPDVRTSTGNIAMSVALCPPPVPPCAAGTTVVQGTNLDSAAPQGNAANGTATNVVSGLGTINSIRVSGLAQEINTATFASELRVRVTAPGGGTFDYTFTTSTAFPIGGTYLSEAGLEQIVPLQSGDGTWTVEVWESFDDGGPTSVDARWLGLCVTAANVASPPTVTNVAWTPSSIGTAVGGPFSTNASTITATVAAGNNPPSTNLVTRVDLSAMGGSATQQMFDDGTNGDATAADGIYSYTFTANNATPTGSFSTTVTASDDELRSATGASTLNIGAVVDLGTLDSASAVLQVDDAALGVGQIRWFSFTLGCEMNAADTEFFDLDTEGSAISDTELGLFDSVGTLIGSDDDGGNGLKSLLTYGTGSGILYDGVAANGNDGAVLAAGTYYLAVGEFNSTFASGFVVTGGDAAGTFDINLNTNLSCAACDGIDFNNDGLFPDTADIDDFLSVFSGGPCSNDPLCSDVDFNNDGLFPDTLDIDALLSVFSGGPCLF